MRELALEHAAARLDDAEYPARRATEWLDALAEACVATPWSVGLKTEYGGMHVGAALSAIANPWRSSASDHRHKAQKAARLAEFIMRANNWQLEGNLAAREISRIDKDLSGLVRAVRRRQRRGLRLRWRGCRSPRRGG
jgi:hypothetical protein